MNRAGVLRRLGAGLYDGLAVTALLMVATALLLPWRHGAALPAGALWYQCCLLGVAYVYFGLSWTRGGQTLGMRAWRIELRRRDATPVGWLRALARFALMLPLAPLLPWIWLDRERLALHDRLTDTEIVRHGGAAAAGSAHAQ